MNLKSESLINKIFFKNIELSKKLVKVPLVEYIHVRILFQMNYMQ